MLAMVRDFIPTRLAIVNDKGLTLHYLNISQRQRFDTIIGALIYARFVTPQCGMHNECCERKSDNVGTPTRFIRYNKIKKGKRCDSVRRYKSDTTQGRCYTSEV